MHKTIETEFANALLAPNPPSPSKRFAVYRNNVFVSLVDALKTRFPAVQNAVGEIFFEAMARDYASSHRPTSPLMMLYGDSFPAFIEQFKPLADFPWMGDIAHVECAITQSYHAADASPLDRQEFLSLAPETLAHIRFTLHPAIRLVASRFPVVRLWQMNRGEVAITALDDTSEAALIVRPNFTVSVHAISHATVAFLEALQAGHTLATAVDHATVVDKRLDIAAQWQLLIANGLVTELVLDNPNRSPT